MLEELGRSVIFYGFFTEDGAGDTGLTVTVDVWEVARDGTATEIVTAGSATEIGDGLYRYLLAAGSVDAEAEYIAVFKTADTDTDQKHIPAIWVINRANVEDIDDILTDTATTIPTTLSGLAPAGEYDTELDTTISSRAPASEYDTELDATISSRAPAGEYDTELGTTIPDAIAAIDTDSVLDAVVEGTYSLKEVLRIMSGVLAGKLSGGGTTTLTFRDISDSLNRVVATVDSSGNRSAITINEA